MNAIFCPISKKKIDNNVSRLTVFFTVIFMVAFIYTKNPIYMIIATTDTAIRAWLDIKYSPLKWMALKGVNLIKVNPDNIDLAKKTFASRLGMLCGLASVLLYFLGFEWTSLFIAGFWLLLAILDAVFNFCLGCIIYTLLSKFTFNT